MLPQDGTESVTPLAVPIRVSSAALQAGFHRYSDQRIQHGTAWASTLNQLSTQSQTLPREIKVGQIRGVGWRITNTNCPSKDETRCGRLSATTSAPVPPLSPNYSPNDQRHVTECTLGTTQLLLETQDAPNSSCGVNILRPSFYRPSMRWS